ncbi:MAG TPA: hypothetical protein VIF57_00900 [Polyangia bacterium]|jgi:hypothetical protein
MSRYTAAEGRELTRRLAKVRATGGVPHAEVVRETQKDMERDLRKMVRDYKGSPRQAKELLEALVIARAYGVAACDDIERELAERLRKRAA